MTSLHGCGILDTLRTSGAQEVVDSATVWAAGSLAAVFPANAAAAGRAFVPIAASVAGAAALAVPFSLHQPSVGPAAGGPAPASAGVSVVPDPVWHLAFPAVADEARKEQLEQQHQR